MKIGNREVGGEAPCFIVAEVGLSHEGDFRNACKLIHLAEKAEVDAVKFQVYKTNDLISRERAPEMFERFARVCFGYEAFGGQMQNFRPIWFATPHTESAIDFLAGIDVPCFKIGSGEANNPSFLELVAQKGKPIIASLGFRDFTSILNHPLRYRHRPLAFLHCVSEYPVPPERANLSVITWMKKIFDPEGIVTGYSDHTVGIDACIAAVAMGAKIVEKHIKLESSTGNDVEGALFGEEFKQMVEIIRHYESMMGDGKRVIGDEERANMQWAFKDPSDGKRPLK